MSRRKFAWGAAIVEVYELLADMLQGFKANVVPQNIFGACCVFSD